MGYKKPWEDEQGKKIWKTKASFFNYIRGGIRRGLWERHPLKLEFIKQNRKRVPLGKKTEKNPEGLVWGAECCSCHNDFRQNEVVVDHVKGNHSLKSEDDLKTFILNIVFITMEDMAFMCKECHNTKSHAEKKGISFEEAKTEKEVIQIIKDKREKEVLLEAGIEPASNAKKRREQLIKLLGDK